MSRTGKRTRVAAAVMAGLLLGVPGSGRASELVQIAATETGRKLDGFIMDDGRAFAVLASADGQPELSLWEGGAARKLDVPGAAEGEVFTIDPLPDGRLVLSSAVAVGNHWGNFTRQVYGLGAGGSLELLWTGNPELLWAEKPESYREIEIVLSGDGTAWGAMYPRWLLGQYVRKDGLHFAFGDFGSERPRRTVTVSLPEGVKVNEYESFTFLSGREPIVATCHGGDCYLLHFMDTEPRFEVIEPLTSRSEPRMLQGWPTWFRWQDEDRLLWSHDVDGAWLVWHLEDRGLSGPTEGPFLRVERDEDYRNYGRPHEERGFVRTTRGEDRYRLEHLWWSPGSPRLAERHVTPWQQGEAPNLIWVSPNGRHALGVERHYYDREAEDPDVRIRFYGKFLELGPAERARPDVRN